jgi:hypothetical protein
VLRLPVPPVLGGIFNLGFYPTSTTTTYGIQSL